MLNRIYLFSFFISFLSISCDSSFKSEKEIRTENTKEIVLKAYNAQMSGNVELWKSLLSDDFTFTLTGKLDISKTYNWDELMEFNKYFGSLLIGEIGAIYKGVIADEDKAVVFLEGRMEGVGGKYENDYAIMYEVNEDGKISSTKEWLSDILLATQLYGQEICGEKKTLE
tara:strand:- start:13247 stop:13756 length:510 start_codon:yes stop_codon:yes gene_type:complete